MPFPPKKVFIDYLALYEEMRAEERDSLTTSLKTAVEMATSFYSGNKPVVSQLDAQINSVKTAIYAANDFDDWFRLIQQVRTAAEECQKLKTRNNGLALSCRTLHGLASLIIAEMSNNDTFKPLLERKIQEKEERIRELEQHKSESLKTKNGRLVQDYNSEISSLIKELASLSQVNYIDRAVQCKLFEYLPLPTAEEVFNFAGNEGNCVGPLELQERYCRWLYARQFQTTKKHIGFDEFIAKSITRFHEQEAKDRENAERAASVAAAIADTDAASAAAASADAASSSSSLSSPAAVSHVGVFAPKPAAAKRSKVANKDAANDEQSAHAAARSNQR